MSFTLLGILNSQAAGGGGATFEHIETITGSGSSFSITNIPQDYAHLHIRATLQADKDEVLLLNFNGDTGTNYSKHHIKGSRGNSIQSVGYANTSTIEIGEAFADNWTGSVSGLILDLYDYSNTSKYKTVQYRDGQSNEDRAQVSLGSGNWRSFSGITSIQLGISSGVITSKTQISIYGVRA